MSYQQYKSLDKNLIFAEYFNDEQSVRRNGGVPTNVTFDKGVSEMNGSSFINYKDIQHTEYPLSIRAIVKNSSTAPISYDGIVSMDDGASNRVFYLGRNIDGTFRIRAWDSAGSAYILSTTINDTEQHELIATITGTHMYIYVDGILKDSSTFTGLYNGNRFLEIGRYGENNNFGYSGDISLVEIYNKALTQEEVTNLYNNSRYVLPNLEHGGRLGEELTSNSDFTDWTAGVPDDWSIGNLGAEGNITEVSNGLRWIFNLTDGTAQKLFTTADVAEDTKKYKRVITIADWVKGKLLVYERTSFNKLGEVDGNGVHEFYYTADGDGQPHIYRDTIADAEMTIVSDELYEVVVEPTKLILDVNAFDGFARNRLSGDVASIAYQSDFSSSVDGMTADWGTAGAGVMSHSNGNLTFSITTQPSSSAALRPQVTKALVMTSGKKYRLIVKGTGIVAGYYSGGTFVNITDIDLNVAPLDITFTADGSTLILYYNGQTYPDFVISEVGLEEIIPEVTNTDIEVVREGSQYVPRFNGNSSNIDCGDYNDLTGDITVLGWIKRSNNSVSFQKILSNGQFVIQCRDDGVYNDRLYVINNGTGNHYTSESAVPKQEYVFFAILRKADGKLTWYINGEVDGVEFSGNAPSPGTIDIFVGSQGSSGEWDGEIPEVKVIEGLLTPEEINQAYTSTKHLYNK